MASCKSGSALSRRVFLLGGGASFIMTACAQTEAQMPETDAGTQFYSESPFRALTDEDWQARLSAKAYYVLREAGTERAFTSDLNTEKRDGIYHCAGCDLALFSSETKYDSGTGWPSFYQALENRIATSVDYKIGYPRTEYHCARCLGHQGHVFKDGPVPTGLRYCNNGVALKFVPAEVPG